MVGTVGLVGYLSFKNGQEAIAETRGSINATFLLCLGALAIATLLGIYTARWIASPIKRLNQASAAIASGDLDQTVELTSSPA
ncbi:MAG: HAMP domain-containing protein [Hydrococcus sp. RU_2_2]|nr:HAMP domain-containing protein [Hydrococcus sp. RU_2_2]NJP21506.1 HAMP domain-containing protein [Hydrococcus sp. CRU_1_1]